MTLSDLKMKKYIKLYTALNWEQGLGVIWEFHSRLLTDKNLEKGALVTTMCAEIRPVLQLCLFAVVCD